MKVCLLKNDYISSIELPHKIQGQYWLKDKTDIDQKEILAIEGIGEQWVLKSNKSIYLKNGETSVVLKNDVIYQLTNLNQDSIYVYIEEDYQDTVYLKYKLKFKDQIISVGRHLDNTIQINNPAVSGNHFNLIYHNHKWILQDQGSTNGTFVNDYKVDKCDLKIGDIVYILGAKIIIGDEFLSISKNSLITINTDELEQMTFGVYKSDDDFEENEVQYFYRSPRIKKDIQTKKIQIDSPPENQNQEEMPMMLILGPSITMGMTSLSTAFFAINNAMSNGGDISSALPSIVMSLSMLLGTVMWPILTKKYEKKNKRLKEEKRQKKYGQYLDIKEKEISECAQEQFQIWNDNFPSIDQCIQNILNRDQTLFERSMRHNDFLELRVGLGKRRVNLDIQYSKKSFSLTEDYLRDRLYSICEKEKVIDNVPITISLMKQSIFGIVGENKATQRFLKNLLVQMMSFYSYDEVKLVFLYDEHNKDLDCLKWSPFVFDNQKENRFIARNMIELKEISTYLDSMIAYRESLHDEELMNQSPHYVIICLDQMMGVKASFIKKISKTKKNLHCSVIHIYDELKSLPNDCQSVIDVQSRNACFYDLKDMTGNKTYFIPDQNNVDLEMICKELANIPLDLQEDHSSLPDMMTFLQMYGVGKIEHLNALNRWKENDPTVSLQAAVGVDNLGAPFYLDLHQKYHGPHGLIAGMTGSGKSEFIMTYILSLALNYHPYEVSFVLIDYKGGGMAKAFEKLPHTCGIITNLDGSSVKRSLISIESELKRRQSLFDKTSQRLGISNLDIYKYQGLYRNSQVNEPLQHLFIISDEFAELKTQQPEFMEKLISAARIGRSLGVHLILATQKPSGVVDDQIWSNSRFRVCLKVQERADSMDMLKRPDAAELKHTGRFYLQVGYNELFELGQSAWAGAPYYPSDKPIIEKDKSVSLIDINGHVIQKMIIDQKKSMFAHPHKQIDDITEYLSYTAKEEGICIKPLWLDPIPEMIYLDELLKKYKYEKTNNLFIDAVIGEYDDPVNQKQDLSVLSISQTGNTIMYGSSGSGKTTLLSTMIYSLISTYSTKDIHLYILDFSSETLTAFEDAPQVGDVLLSYHEEKIINLVRMLKKELKTRKREFANFGGDIITYNMNSDSTKHSIIVFIHNYAAFSEIYEDIEDDIYYLTREGMKYGIYFIITAQSTTGIRFRVLQNFSYHLCLSMNDDSDYASIMGKTEGVLPAKLKGRGLIKVNENIYEFQSAHISKELNSYQSIRDYCIQLKESSWEKAKSVPILPKVVTVDFMKENMEKRQYLSVPIGIEETSLEAYYYPFANDYLNFIMSDEDNDFLPAVVPLISAYQPQIYIFDSQKLQLSNYESLKIYQTKEEMIEGISALFDMILYRNNTYKKTDDLENTLKSFENAVIIFTSLYDLLGTFDDTTNEKLELILEKGKSEYKVNILIFEKVKNLSSLSYTNWFKVNASTKNVIWYGAGLADQYVYNLSNKGSHLYDNLPRMFGFVVQNNKYKRIKFLSNQS